MKLGPSEVDLSQLLVRNFFTCRIFSVIHGRLDSQSFAGRRCFDQIDDDFVTDERLPSPVLGYEGEEPMLNLIPFARARRQMADLNWKPQLFREFLQFHFPETNAAAVASSAI